MLRRVRKFFSISIIKSIAFNIKYFGLKGLVEFPVLIARNTVFENIGGQVIIDAPSQHFGIKIGFSWASLYGPSSKTIWNNKGTVKFCSTCVISRGSVISCEEDGVLSFGRNFQSNEGCRFICAKEISFAHNVLVSWDCTFMDTDFHTIIRSCGQTNVSRSIEIASDCWIGFECVLLKGAKLSNGNVLACRSLLAKEISKSNCLVIGGKIADEQITWHR